jgi:hypothetical protein
VQSALSLAIVLVAAPSFAQQGQGKAEGAKSNKAEACRAAARQADYAIRRGSGSSSIASAQADKRECALIS